MLWLQLNRAIIFPSPIIKTDYVLFVSRLKIFTASKGGSLEQVCFKDGSLIQTVSGNIWTPSPKECDDSIIDRTFAFSIYSTDEPECDGLTDVYAYFQEPKSRLYLTQNE